MGCLSDSIPDFVPSQFAAWRLARENYAALGFVERRTVAVGGTYITVQFNPRRVRSTAADVDTAAIRGRKCFLCAGNRPAGQGSLRAGGYDVLVNPFPVFPLHLTIACGEHLPQSINGRMGDMLALAEELSGFHLFYNGPESGASAPDHLHFQAVGGECVSPGRGLVFGRGVEYGGCLVSSGGDLLRKAVKVEGGSAEDVEKAVEHVIEILRDVAGSEDEPKMNIFAEHSFGIFSVIIFPRAAHRPEEFFAEGEGKILFSPGALDYAGEIITVRREDYERLDAGLLTKLFAQTTVYAADWERFEKRLKI